MEQESISKKIAVIGGGPAGCICAKFLQDAGYSVSIFEKYKFLKTLLPTGGGKCNLAYSEYDFMELAKNYPRGEKFLYSVFSKFSTQDTIDFFNSIGVETYTREDRRIFPVSNSASKVRGKLLNSLRKTQFIHENVLNIEPNENSYKIITDNDTYLFDIVVIAIGGHAGTDILKNLDINIIPQTQSLVGLITREDLSALSGVRVPNVEVKLEDKILKGDILFTHKGVSGPVIYTLSSVFARKDLPYSISIKLAHIDNFQDELNKNSHKTIGNALKQYMPKAVAMMVLKYTGTRDSINCAYVGKTQRNFILEKTENFVLRVIGKMPKGEVVTCGGIDLNEINPKTLESKKYKNLYFCGEILDIDGFCGGFNLQNCWSTGFVAATAINQC